MSGLPIIGPLLVILMAMTFVLGLVAIWFGRKKNIGHAARRMAQMMLVVTLGVGVIAGVSEFANYFLG